MLDVENLTIAYGDVPVVLDVSFGVGEREVVAIIGRNGSGKTTLLRTIAGFLRPMKGDIKFNGESIVGTPPYQIAKMGIRYVRSDKKVFERFTVKENLELACYASDDWDMDRVLEIFPALRRLLNNRAGSLSGGERQMLLLARSIIGKPKLLLLDEPTEGLMAGVIADIGRSFELLKKEGLSILLVEQHMPLVFSLSDRIIVMREGKFVKILLVGETTPRECESWL